MSNFVFDADLLPLAARVADIFGSSHGIAYAEISSDLTVVRASANFRDLTVDPSATVEGRVISDLLWEFIGAELVFKDLLTGKRPDYLLERVQRERPDGSEVYLTFRVTRLSELSPARLLLIIEDTTSTSHLEQHLRQERNELRLVKEQLVQANLELDKVNRFKSFILSMAAHDMRTPLTAIRGYADLLMVDPNLAVSTEHKDILVTMRRQADQLKLLITNLLDLGQIEQGRLRIYPVTCDLNAQAREVMQATHVVAAKYDIELRLELTENLLLIQADTGRIQQILQNLVDNAVKYTATGGTVRIITRLEKDRAIVQVVDTGRGMTETQLANLFRLYYRTDEAQESKAEGSGLGLYIVKTLVEAHYGKIAVSSQRNEGTTFTLSFPLHL